MESIIQIKGKVNFSITLDPTVWIFDDRKVNLDTYFTAEHVEINADDAYVEGASKFWSREIMEGASYPPTLKSEKKFDRQQMKIGTFGIVLKPFLENAEPTNDATQVTFINKDNEEFTYSIEEAKNLLFQFSLEGKILSEDGPVYLLNPDGSNFDEPIKNIVGIRVD